MAEHAPKRERPTVFGLGRFASGRPDMAQLWRLAFWGSGTAVMLLLAVVAGSSHRGSERLAAAVAGPEPRPDRVAEQPVDPEVRLKAQVAEAVAARNAVLQKEAERLAEAVHRLAADRDRLTTRLAAIEQNLSDVTGSISRERALRMAHVAPAAEPAQPPAAAAPSADPAKGAEPRRTVDQTPTPPSRPAGDTAKTVKLVKMTAPAEPSAVPAPASADPPPGKATPPAKVPATGQPPEPTAPATVASLPRIAPNKTRAAPDPADSAAIQTEFGVDVGSAATVEALRSRWSRLRKAHAALLGGLRPVVSIRDVAKRHTVELRLVVGPLRDAQTAARLCAELNGGGVSNCQPAVFDGQRLALR